MTILIDGIDCTGKSTMAQKLAQKHHVIKHMTGKQPNTYSFYKKLIKEYGCNLILDRSFLGELVYGPKYRGKSRISFEDVARLLNNRKVLVDVRLIGDFKAVEKQMEKRFNEQGVPVNPIQELIDDQVTWLEVITKLYPMLTNAAKKRFYVNSVEFKGGNITMTEVQL